MDSYATIDFLALWEHINNLNFNRIEFHTVRNESGRLVTTPNIRDNASAEELVVVINLEDTNADLIRQGFFESFLL